MAPAATRFRTAWDMGGLLPALSAGIITISTCVATTVVIPRVNAVVLVSRKALFSTSICIWLRFSAPGLVQEPAALIDGIPVLFPVGCGSLLHQLLVLLVVLSIGPALGFQDAGGSLNCHFHIVCLRPRNSA